MGGEGHSRYLAIHHAVAVALARGQSVEASVVNVLSAVCKALRWQFGAMFVVDAQTRLLRSAWHYSSDDGTAAFAWATERTTLARGVGLPGRVLATGRPAWIV